MKRAFSSFATIILLAGLGMAQSGPGPAGGAGARVIQRRGMIMMRSGGPMMRARRRMMWASRGRRMQAWWRNPYLARRLGLTEAQRQQLEKINFQTRLQMIDLRAAVERQQLLLRPMLQTDHPDEQQVLAQVDKIGQARLAMVRARIKALLAARNVLTPEQWHQLREWRNRPLAMRFRARPVRPLSPPPPAGHGR